MLGVSLGTGRRQGAPNEQPNVLLSRVEAEAVLTSPCFWSVLGCPQSDQGQSLSHSTPQAKLVILRDAKHCIFGVPWTLRLPFRDSLKSRAGYKCTAVPGLAFAGA